jgi:hypothetical protein
MNPFEEPLKVAALMDGFKQPWFVAGGWAIDLYLGRITRFHQDIEVAILRTDQLLLQQYLQGWRFDKVIPDISIRIETWNINEWLDLPVHEIYAYENSDSTHCLEVLFNEVVGHEWIFRRDARIVRDLSLIGLRTDIGIPILCPEIVLLYKAKHVTQKDQADFNIVIENMNSDSRIWLKNALEICSPQHHWLRRFIEV